MNKQLYALLFSMAIAGGGQKAAAQVVQGSNGSHAQLSPLSLNKKTARRLSSKTVKLRADFVASSRQYFVVGLDTLLTPETEAIVARHAEVLTYVPERMYILTTSTAPETALAAIKRDLKGLANITAEGALPADYKIAQRLYEPIKAAASLPQELVQAGVVVATFAPEDRAALEQTLDKWEVPYELTVYEQVRLLEPSAQLVAQIAALPYVSFVNVYEEPQPLAADLAYITQANRITALNYDLKGPTGEGVTFANWEPYGGEYEHDINTYGRNVANAPDGSKLTDNTINGHGTTCGLIVSGADNIEENRNRGMAPGVRIIAMNDRLKPWGVHYNGVNRALEQGFKPLVSNHSVGWDIKQKNHYNEAAATVDNIIYRRNDYMCCYPTGNYAYGNAKYDDFQDYDYGRISGDIKTNKNGLAVHSVIYPGVDVTWANFGPTFDGRMKPELCAQGSGGTSYASPGVAGLTSVLLEQCKKSFNTYRVDIVKAVMINTALDVRTYANNGMEEGFGLDYRTGYGEVHPLAAAKSMTEGRVEHDKTVTTGQSVETKITVPEHQTELNVTLYWNDPAAAAGASKTLINNLDLEVVNPQGEVILPWTLDPTPANVTKPAQRVVNTRDNHERVRIVAAKTGETLPAGEYTIRVKGTKVARGPQKFVTTWQWKQRGIEWTSIPEGFRLAAGEEVLLTWDMTVTEEEDKKAPNFRPNTMTPTVYYRTTPLQAGQEDPTQPNSGWKKCTAADGTRYWKNDMKGGQQSTYGGIYGKNFLKWIVPEDTPNTAHLQFMVVAGPTGPTQLRALSNKAQVGEQPATRPQILAISEDKVKLSWDTAEKVKKGKFIIYALYDKYMTKVGEVPIDQTTAEIAPPLGVKWDQNQFFAIGTYDEEAGALSKRSLPIGLDPLNSEATEGETWAQSYTLCPGDVSTFKTNQLEGDVQWYKGKQAIPAPRGTQRTLQLTMNEVDEYYYTISLNNDVVYISPSFTIASGGINRSDAEKWGEYAWAGYVYGKESGSTLPALTETTPFHGKFELNKFSFNSHSDLFPWDKGRASEIEGYLGCPSQRDTEAMVVMKRKGFVSGTYNLKFTRASGIAKAIIVDAAGKRTEKTTAANAFTSNIGSFKLDENSSIELHWTGVHCAFEATYNASAADRAVYPGHATPTPSFWLDPTVLNEAHGNRVKLIRDGFAQAETYKLTTTTGALFNKDGSNYNAALYFDGKSSYTGGMRAPNTTTSATDFVVLSTQRNQGNDRIISFGKGTHDSENAGSYALLVDNYNRLSTVRNLNTVSQNYSNARIGLFTIARNASTITIAHNGAKAAASVAGSSEALDLQKISIGGSFDSAEPKYLRGTLAEVIHYDAPVNEANAKRIRTYLAIKHGLTLDHDYMGASTQPLFPISTSGKYKFQVTGIGREDLSRLNQRQSRGQHLSGAPSQLILSLGDLAASNSENINSFAANGSYYILAANNDIDPYQREGDVSRLHYLLRSTVPSGHSKDKLSFILPRANFLQPTKRAYIEFSAKEFTSLTTDAPASTFVELKDYTVDGVQYLRAEYTPQLLDTYFRVVWKEGNVAGIEQLDQHAQSLSYDPASRVVTIGFAGAERLDLTDLQGRVIAAHLPIVGEKAQLPLLAPSTYLLTLRNTKGILTTMKLNVVQ